MIIRETRIIECWCPKCGAGQVAQILQKSFEEKKALDHYIAKTFTCPNCNQENTVEDILQMIPESFLVTSRNDINKHKKNNDLKNFLES